MWKTALALLVTIIVIPFIAFTMDEPVTVFQKEVLTDMVTVYLVAALLCFLISTITGNHSQVDKLWSLVPIAYVWMVTFHSGFESRLVIMALLVTAWGFRLTYNFSRRGGYSVRFWTGEEDYRWAVLRAKPELAARWRWVLFNLFFISLYQMGLILLFTLPAVRSLDGTPLGWADYVLAILLISLIVIETIADQQQWNYHKEKQRLLASKADLPDKYKKGFIHTGLWGRMRHPNYAAEQAIWIGFYFFSVAATWKWLKLLLKMVWLT